MKAEDFDKVLIKVSNVYTMPGDEPEAKLAFKMEEVPAYETDKMYKTVDNQRIAKTRLLKPVNRFQMLIPVYEAYCLPGDEHQAAEIIRKLLEPQLDELLGHIQAIVSAIKGGVQLFDGPAYFARNLAISDQNRARRKALEEPQESPKP
ncbi:hypothetical protein RBE51_20245 [Pseudomonas taiwanensis]|jgi:hypothetical protein|uniref:hypothetical protein n=1 Tax=Pseudomonas taiwanensis TaxID=470150 RepID=UPI0028DD8FC9|nr:hypothetical protein [Pseudomonas taiwanensis]MDT8925125.1 hypothetical protein [Pseudomonas taiwanensis]